MGQKVTFDPTTKIIQVDEVPDVDDRITLDIQIDLYSDGKEDWKASAELFKYRFPVRAVGGDPTANGSLGTTYFLAEGWYIRPYEGDHRLSPIGNLFKDDGSSPFIKTVGSFNVVVESFVSNLVDASVAQLAEIEYASFNGGVSYDADSPWSGTGKTPDGHLIGSPAAPVNNVYDAGAIALLRGFLTGYVLSDLVFPTELPLADFTFIGYEHTLHIPDGAQMINCAFEGAVMTGRIPSPSHFDHCHLRDIQDMQGTAHGSSLEGGMTLKAGGQTTLLDCWAIISSSYPNDFEIDLNGTGALAAHNASGNILLTNKTGDEPVSIELNSGQIKLGNSIIAGEIVCRGVGKLIGATLIELLTNPNMLNDTDGWTLVGPIGYSKLPFGDTYIYVNGFSFDPVYAETEHLYVDVSTKYTVTVNFRSTAMETSEVKIYTRGGLIPFWAESYSGEVMQGATNHVVEFTTSAAQNQIYVSYIFGGGEETLTELSGISISKTEELPVETGVWNGATIVNELLESRVLNQVDETTLSTGAKVDIVDTNLDNVGVGVGDIHEAHFNRRNWDKTGKTITIYEADGVTPKHVFDVNDDLSDITPQ